MIHIARNIAIDENELDFEFVRSSGPGGQNVNKVSTAVQLRYDVENTATLPEEVKTRLKKLSGKRMTQEGVLIIKAYRYRTQEQNRFDAIERLVDFVKKAAEKPKTRRSTRPSVTSKARRLAEKKHRGQVKRLRHFSPDDWE